MNTADDKLHLEYYIPHGDFSIAGNASSEVKKTLRHLGVRSDIVRRVAIATYEAEMNIVIHSLGGMILLDITPEKIEILCKDKGPGIANIELAMQEGYSTAPDRIRELGFGAGMGLPNIKRCSDKFDIQSVLGEGTRVKITIYL